MTIYDQLIKRDEQFQEVYRLLARHCKDTTKRLYAQISMKRHKTLNNEITCYEHSFYIFRYIEKNKNKKKLRVKIILNDWRYDVQDNLSKTR